MGLSIVPLRPSADGKACLEKDWRTRTFSVEDFHDGVTGIGVKPGEQSNGLGVIDVDHPVLATCATLVLPPTELIDGRPGKDPGHFFYNIKTAWENAVLKAHDVKPQRTVTAALSDDCKGKLAEIDLHFHDLRHEAGSRKLEAGWPLHAVSVFLGHANVTATALPQREGRLLAGIDRAEAACAGPLIWRRLLEVVNDDHVNRRAARFEFQSQLFFERGEEGRTVTVRALDLTHKREI